MRMSHYFLAFALLAPLALLSTAWTGAMHDGSGRHFALGLSTAILCVALNTLVILFMVVTGRVLKQAMKSRSLAPEFLRELNAFFREKRGYPVAVMGASLAAITAVLGYGSRIGVPTPVHMSLGVAMVVFELWATLEGYRTLRGNQVLIDRVAKELDAMDRAGAPVDEQVNEPEWRFGLRGRWFFFACVAWVPYLYWGFIAWRGDFGELSSVFLIGTALVSGLGFVNGLRTPRGVDPDFDPGLDVAGEASGEGKP